MGLMNDKDNNVQLLIDREVLEGESLGCHPCINTSSLRLNTKEVMEKFLPADPQLLLHDGLPEGTFP